DWRLCRSRDGRVFVQREVRPPFVIIGHEESERASKRSFIPHDDVIETLPPQGPDEALHKRILPRTARRRHHFVSAKTLQQATEVVSVDAVSIPHQIRRGSVVWKRFADLLPRPRGRRMVGHVQMYDAAAVV